MATNDNLQTSTLPHFQTLSSRIPAPVSSLIVEGAPLGGGQADSDLIERALAGDPGAFAALCERYRSHVWRTVASVARGPDAEDLAQEAIVRAYCALHRFRGDAPFQAWLCRIALNAAHDYLRTAWKRRVFQADAATDSPGESPSAAVERRETAREVRKAVARLPETQRTPIWLYYFEGFSYADIARLEKTSESTIRSRIKAGLKRMEGYLDEFDECVVERQTLKTDSISRIVDPVCVVEAKHCRAETKG